MTGTRDRFIATTLELFRRQGYNGTSLKQVTDAAGAPTGSLYHHFKGGKDELTRVVLETAGAAYGDLLTTVWDEQPDPVSALTAFFEGAALVLEESDFIDPCPIGTVAREIASTNDPLRATALAVFESWIEKAADRLAAAGIAQADARELAVALVAGIEGGFILSRTARDAEPIRAIGRQLIQSVGLALEQSSSSAAKR